MRVFLPILFGVFLSCAPAWSQINFDMDFGSNPPSFLPQLPNGTATLSNNIFSVSIFLPDVLPQSGSIGVLANVHGHPIFEPELTFPYPPVPVTDRFGNVGGVWQDSWELTSLQVQALTTGQFYAEIVYPLPSETLLGQIIPVPEPPKFKLLVGGILVLALIGTKRKLVALQ